MMAAMQDAEPKQPHRRQWLGEAYKIYRGDATIQPKRQHVAAVMQALIEFQEQAKTMRDLMKKAYEEAVAVRKAQGLPVPPPLQELPGPHMVPGSEP